MKNTIGRTSFALILISGMASMGASSCPLSKIESSSSTVAVSATPSPSPTHTTTPDPTLTALTGIWETACASTGNIDSAAAYTKRSLSFYPDSTFDYIISYYSGSGCTGNLIWEYTPGTLTIGSATTAPASGHLVRFIHGSSVAIYTTSMAGANQLNAHCGWGGTFTSNGGLQPGGDWSCTGDSRFTLKGPNTVVDLAVVVSGTTLSTTSLSLNMPGVQNGVSVDTSTSVIFTKQ